MTWPRLWSNSLDQAEVAGDAAHLGGLVGEHEAGAGAALPGAAGAADPVHVGVAVAGSVEVDHVGDVGDVDAAGGHVGGDQHFDVTALEAGEGAFALALALVAVHRDGLEFAAAQALDQPVGAALGADEDQGAAAVGAGQGAGEVVELGRLGVDVDEAVFDLGLAALRRRVGVVARVAGVGGGELAGRALERRREEEGLALIRRVADDPVDRRLEAHVEHAVGLVEDEDADALQVDRAARDQVLEPARGGDDDVGALRRLDLGAEADAAVDGGDLQVAGAGDRARARRRSGSPARGSAPAPGRRGPCCRA